MMSKHKKALNRFTDLIEQNLYYEAHEVLEELWFPRRFEKSDEVTIIKAFINASVSFELLKRGKEKASKKVWKNYEKYRALIENDKSLHCKEHQKILLLLQAKKVELI